MDKTLVCRDCGKEFLFTEGEQAFYKEKGFDNEPTRCVDCRRARKAAMNNRNNINCKTKTQNPEINKDSEVQSNGTNRQFISI